MLVERYLYFEFITIVLAHDEELFDFKESLFDFLKSSSDFRR